MMSGLVFRKPIDVECSTKCHTEHTEFPLLFNSKLFNFTEVTLEKYKHFYYVTKLITQIPRCLDLETKG
jgi:hypothetical protein